MKNKHDSTDGGSARKESSVLKALLSAIAAMALAALAASMFLRSRLAEPVDESRLEDRQTDTVAYLSDMEAGIAMFVVPVNFSTNGHYGGFEIKASTNNFDRVVSRAVGNDAGTVAFYAQSAWADPDSYGDSTLDHMKIFACNLLGDRDYRSYCWITNTLVHTRHMDSVIVLVDAECLVRNPGTNSLGNSTWMNSMNCDLNWVYCRTADGTIEAAPGSEHMAHWRPIAPVRWFKTMPVWGGTFEELKGVADSDENQ